MSGNFFSKSKIDTDEIASLKSDLDDLAASADSFRDEMDTYKSDLESAASDLEDAETADEVAEVIRQLRDISVPDGYDNPDGNAETIADALDELETNKSEYDEWQENVQDGFTNVLSLLNAIGRGSILPSQKGYPYSFADEDKSQARIVRLEQPQDGRAGLPYSADTDAWSKALNWMCNRAATVHAPGDAADATVATKREAMSKEFACRFRELVTMLMAYQHASGSLIVPNDQPMLALMWFVDDLLQRVGLCLGGSGQSRMVLTNAFALANLHRVAAGVQQKFGEGCEKIDESMPSRS